MEKIEFKFSHAALPTKKYINQRGTFKTGDLEFTKSSGVLLVFSRNKSTEEIVLRMEPSVFLWCKSGSGAQDVLYHNVGHLTDADDAIEEEVFELAGVFPEFEFEYRRRPSICSVFQIGTATVDGVDFEKHVYTVVRFSRREGSNEILTEATKYIFVRSLGPSMEMVYSSFGDSCGDVDDYIEESIYGYLKANPKARK